MLVLSWSQSIGWSLVAGRVAAMTVAFVVARNLVFRSPTAWAGSFSKYLLLVATMGLVSYSMIQFLYMRAGLSVIVAKVLAEGLLFWETSPFNETSFSPNDNRSRGGTAMPS